MDIKISPYDDRWQSIRNIILHGIKADLAKVSFFAVISYNYYKPGEEYIQYL